MTTNENERHIKEQAFLALMRRFKIDTGLSHRRIAGLLNINPSTLSRWFSPTTTQRRGARDYSMDPASARINKLNDHHTAHSLYYRIEGMTADEKVVILRDVLHDKIDWTNW